MRKVTTYKEYTVFRTESENYAVKTPKGILWEDHAVSLKTAKKWIDCDISDRKYHNKSY